MNTYEKGIVSVIIPTYNRRRDLDKCITTILKQNYKKVEIIIVDDASFDGTNDYIKKKYPKINIISNKKNMGLNYCRNLGIFHSKGEYILLLDSDVELTNKRQINNMVNVIKKDSKIGCIGGVYEEPYPCVKAFNFDNELDFDIEDSNSLKECDYVGGGNLFFKKELGYKVGGFDEFIKGDSTEDEFCLGLKRMNYINLFGPKIAAKHNKSPIERNNIGLGIKQKKIRYNIRELWFNRNRLRYFIKNFGLRKGLKVFLLKFPKDIISVIAFIKQQFFNIKTNDSKKFDNFEERGLYLLFKIRLIFDPLIWNFVNIMKTIKSRKINFIEAKNEKS